DPYYQQGGDMVRVGGMGYRIDVNRKIGSRISDMTHLATGEPIDPARNYVVAGWASVNEGTEGPPIWEVVENHIRDKGVVSVTPNEDVIVGMASTRRRIVRGWCAVPSGRGGSSGTGMRQIIIHKPIDPHTQIQ